MLGERIESGELLAPIDWDLKLYNLWGLRSLVPEYDDKLAAIKRKRFDLWERYKRVGGTAKGGCFVATAAYGDESHPHVRILREFRDQELMPSATGRLFVAGYYEASPGPAAWISRHDGARGAARAMLWPVTLAAGSYLYTAWWQKGLFFVAMALGIALAARRRRQHVEGGSR